MILGYIAGLGSSPELCLIPDKPSPWSVPVPIEVLESTDSGVVLLSNEEGITVKIDSGDNSREIEPVRPSRLYLTPNLPERPGFSVSKVKITPFGSGKYRVMFDRERGWEPWQPNVKLY